MRVVESPWRKALRRNEIKFNMGVCGLVRSFSAEYGGRRWETRRPFVWLANFQKLRVLQYLKTPR